MRLILSPKDNLDKIVFDDVETYCQEGEWITIVFEDGRARSYPSRHVWYIEVHTDEFKMEW